MAAKNSPARDSSTHRSPRERKVLALAFLGLPAVLFGALAVAEGGGAEPGWWGHLVQLAVLALIAAVSWVRPPVGGSLLLLAGAALLASVLVREGGGLATVIPLAAFVVAPVVIAGVLLIRAGRGT